METGSGSRARGDGDISENETAVVTFAENVLETAASRMKMSELSTVTFTQAPLQ